VRDGKPKYVKVAGNKSGVFGFRKLDLVKWGNPFVTGEAILLFYDNDEAGRHGVKRMRVNKNIMEAGVMEGFKDLNEMLVRGMDINQWVCRRVEKLGLV
jgi:hypothetical protein